MPLATSRTAKYTYRSSGGGTADVNIEYSADLSALSRLEVSEQYLHILQPSQTLTVIILSNFLHRTRSDFSAKTWNPNENSGSG